MVIIGYQGIGKSTLANEDVKYIDLESSNFFVDGKRADNWYVPYCNIAIHLSEQGYNVFVSSHEVVRRELSKAIHTNAIVICPSIELKDVWIEKLKNRYDNTKLIQQEGEKNYKAYMNALDRYEDNIAELISEKGFKILQITDMNYDLCDIVAKME